MFRHILEAFAFQAFIKKVLSAFSQMKLFAVEFRCILEVLCDGPFPVVYTLGVVFLLCLGSRK